MLQFRQANRMQLFLTNTQGLIPELGKDFPIVISGYIVWICYYMTTLHTTHKVHVFK